MYKSTLFCLFMLVVAGCSSQYQYAKLSERQCKEDAKALGKEPILECFNHMPDPSYREYETARDTQ